MTLPHLLLGLALALQAPSAPAPVKVRITVAHVAPGRWRVDYRFGTPVGGLVFDPPVAGYRATAWRPLTPGVRLDTLADGSEALVVDGAARTRLSVEVARFARFDHGRYVPQIPFTDGGTALFLRYL
ncbi:MAG TPA: hypothetical protein VFS40_10850, partial [Gemmatimonadales bacterium]|nr:hypothetical protein [Gemmatimonadales bacterium]